MQYYEDKKCRICGLADSKNINLFSTVSSRTLVSKILAVYPIVFYENDPLPQNICRNCMSNVSCMYNDIQRVMKNQHTIEESNAATRNIIKTKTGNDICQQSINHVFFAGLSESCVQSETNSTRSKRSTTPQKSAASTSATTLNTSDTKKTTELKVMCKKSPKIENQAAKLKRANKRSNIKDLQSKLEQNGCTLLTVNSKKSKASNAAATDTAPRTSGRAVVLLKKDIDDDCESEDDVALSKIATVAASKTEKKPRSLPPPLKVKCQYCPMQFEALSTLAVHQLVHMRLRVSKMLEKKHLRKSLRRGRLLTLENRKCIRCLNCWRIFIDNKSILDHWTLGECDFYCHICGMEFAEAPKDLREHVPAVHGISYRSSKLHRSRASGANNPQVSGEDSAESKAGKSDTAQEPPLESEEESKETPPVAKVTSSKVNDTLIPPKKTKKLPKQAKVGERPVACSICDKTFHNYKARNSHMRKHKPSYMFGDVVRPLNAGEDVYVQKVEKSISQGSRQTTTGTTESNAAKKDTPKINADDSPGNTQPSSTSSINEIRPTVTPASSTPPVFNHTTVLRGVRTKYVNRRSDLNSASPVIKIKPISDLQSNLPNIASTSAVACTTSSSDFVKPIWVTAPRKPDSTIKEEPDDDIDSFVLGTTAPEDSPNMRPCMLCGRHFVSKLEFLRHKRYCAADL